MSSATSRRDAPEFHLVVRRPSRSGPLAPYRFMLSVGFTLLVAGQPIWYAIEDGVVSDRLLLQAGAAGFFMWVVSGIVNRILTESSTPLPGADVDEPAN